MQQQLKAESQEYLAWYNTRPPEVQRLIDRFKPGMAVAHEGQILYVMGYAETKDGPPGLYLTPIWPGRNYDEAVAGKRFVHAECLATLGGLEGK